MAQNLKKQAKQRNRVARRAAEAAAEQAAAEQAAKERRQQTIIGGIAVAVVVVLIALIAVVFWNSRRDANDNANMSVDEAYSKVQAVENKPARADKQGGILLSNKGYGQKVDGVPTVGIYMDFICPGCGSVNQQLDPTLIKLVNAGQLNLELHFLSFMDSYSTDEYSSRAANAALYIADHDDDPDHLLSFVSNLYAKDFQPSEGSGYKSVSDDKLKEQATKAGVSQTVADKAFGRDYQDWLDAMNVYTPKRSELLNTSGTYEGSFTTPTLTINGKRWNLSDVTAANMTLVDGFLESVGLSSDQVGVEGALPSIGADKDPISVMTGE